MLQSDHVHLPDCESLASELEDDYFPIEFFTFNYDSLPISFQSGIAFFNLAALDKMYTAISES